jgi:hypothetical protein
VVVWVCRPELADLAHVAAVLGPHHTAGTNTAGTDTVRTDAEETGAVIVLCGEGPYPADEVAATLDRPVLGCLPADKAGAAALWAGGARSWARSALGRATRDLAEALVGRLSDDPGAQPAESTEAPSGRRSSDDSHEPVHSRRSDADTVGAAQ